MNQNEMTTATRIIETATSQKELQILLAVIKAKEKELEDVAEKRAREVSSACYECQKKIEEQVSTLFPAFRDEEDNVFFKISVKDMAAYLAQYGYKVDFLENENTKYEDCFFRLEDLDFDGMYQDDINDVIIPVVL